jgi:hypothetical protein
MSRRTPQRSGATAKSAKRLSRNRILGIIAAVVVLALVIVGLVINSRFSTAEARRAEAIDTVAAANLILSRLPEDAAATQALITTVMPRTLDAQQLIDEIAAVAVEFNLEIIDTDLAWETQLLSGRDISYGDQLITDLGFGDLRDRSLVEPVTALVSVSGALADINALMTALSERQSADPTTPQLLLRRSDVVLSFTEDAAVATFEVIGIAMTALPAEVRVLIGTEAP